VAVIGGGNAGLEAAVDLLPYASRISLLEFGEQPKGDPATLEKIRENPKFQLITMAQTTEVLGKEFVSGLRYIDRRTGEAKELPAQGVFVEIGSVPNTDFVKDLVDLTPAGEIAVDHKTQATSHPGIWAVGDVSDVLYKQNNISVGDGVKAILNVYETLSKQETARV
jgi:alkyl hydroperoxide reductase subunit F